eukprot:TRINITY_DN38816_c0_g2_i2.p2 TRINITY_DN38816_c0_g2~~TRINITY_DN38816_c0_g2_i2.p2  ORF type:complete len:131 (+),score=29.08 TRINITY_DN38816_c0_g2_i2:176-568(+)
MRPVLVSSASRLRAVGGSTDTRRCAHGASLKETFMKKLVIALGVSVLLGACAGGGMGMGGSSNMNTPMVGGAPMYPTKDIVDNAVNSKDHTTLVAAVKAAGLVDTLKSPGQIGRAVQQECRDRSRMPSSA